MSYYRAPNKTPEVITHLLIINALVFGIQIMFPQMDKLLTGYYFLSPNFKPWQILTHLFAHADISHLFFNMFSLWMFGKILAHLWGTQRFLFFYLSCGLFAFITHELYLYSQYGMNTANAPFLGASGAVYGILVAFATLFPNTQLMLLFPPIPLKAKYLIGGFILMDLFSGISGRSTGIAHFAHLGGALAGFLIIRLWQKNRNKFY